MRQRIDRRSPGRGVIGLVEAGFPEHHARVVAIPVNQIAAFLEGVVLESGGIIVILPAGDAVHHQHAQLIAGIVEGGIVRIVGAADEI